MKAFIFLAAIGVLSVAGGCASSAPSNAYANPVDACASIADEEKRATCIQNVVADFALTAKRNAKERRP